MSNTASSEYKKLSEKNKNLQKEIDEIGNTTTSSLLSKLKYYEEYFRFSIPIFYTSTNRGCKIYSHCSKNYAIVCLVKKLCLAT